MSIVNASEFVKAHIRWTWEAPENADEATAAAEAVAALFTLADGWLDVVALEARLGLYDCEIFTEASTRPRNPFHILVRDPVLKVRIDPMYRPVESRTSALNVATATVWVESKLAEVRVDDARYEPSLRELLIAGMRVRLPDTVASDPLRVSCYAGEIDVPVDHGWVTAPTVPVNVPDPVTLRIANLDGLLRLVLEVFWSPWAGEPEPVTPIRDALSRLRDRGWRVDE